MVATTSGRNTRASDHVREDRLWQRHMEMAKLGATAKGGVNRQALSAEDAAARKLLGGWAAARGYEMFTDPIGNLFVKRPGTDPDAKPVLSGSHLDSQPTGGKFDGTYGVLAAFEVLEALDDAGIATKRPVMAVAWTNEEGNRFQPGCMGSGAFVGEYQLDKLLEGKDPTGATVREAFASVLAAAPVPVIPQLGFPVDSYVEAHIEQGPILENTGNEIGVVTLIQGMRRFYVDVFGDEAHSGTTPLRMRKDALKAAASMVLALETWMADPTDTVRYTVGRFEIYPGSPSTVPGKVHFLIDLRHPEQETLRRLGDGIAPICAAEAEKRGCRVEVREYTTVAPVPLGDEAIGRVRAATQALGYRHIDMISGAGHDAMHIAKVAPAGMVFVPCWKGISHNETEAANAGDLANGARVLADTLAALANR
jgi:beta-ureidopropionase / N-carbamoyl-L-amino-acid hydrolase